MFWLQAIQATINDPGISSPTCGHFNNFRFGAKKMQFFMLNPLMQAPGSMPTLCLRNSRKVVFLATLKWMFVQSLVFQVASQKFLFKFLKRNVGIEPGTCNDGFGMKNCIFFCPNFFCPELVEVAICWRKDRGMVPGTCATCVIYSGTTCFGPRCVGCPDQHFNIFMS